MTTPSTPPSAPGARAIALGNRIFNVPVLPLRANREIYPLCQDLSANAADPGSFIGRLAASAGAPDAVRDDELDKLIKIAYEATCAADELMTLDQFEEMPISPVQLVEAFFVIRLQTGGWLAPENDNSATAGEGEAAGEAPGA